MGDSGRVVNGSLSARSQSYRVNGRLFPHLSVNANLRYGRLFVSRKDRYASVEEVIDLLDIGALLHRDVHALSGGEKQRVAIGRALLASPRRESRAEGQL